MFLGTGVFCWAALTWQSHDHLRFFAYLLSAMVASVLKVRLPGVTGAASVSFLFMLIGIVDLSLPETIVIAACSMLAQCVWRTARTPKAAQVGFSVASIVIAVYVATSIYNYARATTPEPLALVVLAVAFYFANTFPIACIIALTEALPLWSLAMRNQWLLPYYAGGTSLAWLIGTMPPTIQWELPIICLPVVYLIHRSYRTHLGQIEQEKKHMADMNGVQTRTIEALALAIDAKDQTTHDHLQRVQLYALEIGKDLGLSENELHALRAAAVLHDIGKLAVPEHIICKPGKLTPEEFQKMKIHPLVGAEILERVSFPYPVVPIVRSHHERWDGSGYPDGLAGTQIPIGARILGAVDCFDALASDRQYRRALPPEEAMAVVAAESGKSFDPAVVEILQRRYRELESRAQGSEVTSRAKLSTDANITRGAAPGAGFAAEPVAPAIAKNSSAAPGIELPPMNGFNLEEALAIAAVRIKAALPYDAMAFHSKDGQTLRPEFLGGRYSAGLSSIPVAVGAGLIGWVAENREPIVNGNPSEGHAVVQLQSGLAIPVRDDSHKVIAVLSLYRREREAFSPGEVAALLTLEAPLARMMAVDRAEIVREPFHPITSRDAFLDSAHKPVNNVIH